MNCAFPGYCAWLSASGWAGGHTWYLMREYLPAPLGKKLERYEFLVNVCPVSVGSLKRLHHNRLRQTLASSTTP